jgi:hypothetical protein
MDTNEPKQRRRLLERSNLNLVTPPEAVEIFEPEEKKARRLNQHEQAFEYYYALGPSRKVKEVAVYFQISTAVVAMWKAKGKWDKKVAERDGVVDEELTKSAAHRIVTKKIKYSKTIEEYIDEFMEIYRAENKRIKAMNEAIRKSNKHLPVTERKPLLPYNTLIKKVGDLEALIKLELLLLGDASITDPGNKAVPEDSTIEKLLKSDPKCRELLTDLYRRSKSMEGAGS